MLPARLELAQSLIAANAARDALQVMDATPEHQKKHVAAIEQRNRVLMALNDRDGLRKGVDAGLAQARTQELLLQDALSKIQREDHNGARESLGEALAQSPEDPRLLEMLAQTYIDQRRLPAAIQEMRSQVARRPQSAVLHHLLGQLLLLNRSVEEAGQEFRAALAADPKFAPAGLAVAQLDAQQGRPDEAKRILAGLLDTDYKLQAYLLLAQVEQAGGGSAAAVAHYRKVLEIAPNNIVALNNIANRLAASDKLDEALRFAERAKEIAPDNPAISDTLGWLLYQKGRHQLAVQYLEQAVGREATPRRKFHLGMAYCKAGDLQRGRETLQAALKMDPKLPEAKTAEEFLRTP